MSNSDNTDSGHTDENEDKKSIEQKIQEHIERRKSAYIKMSTVDQPPDD